MKKALGYFQKIENGVLIGTFIIMVIASFVQVLNRNIFHLGISWLEELSRYCMIYMALLAAGNWFKRWYADCGYSFDRQA